MLSKKRLKDRVDVYQRTQEVVNQRTEVFETLLHRRVPCLLVSGGNETQLIAALFGGVVTAHEATATLGPTPKIHQGWLIINCKDGTRYLVEQSRQIPNSSRCKRQQLRLSLDRAESG